MLNLTVLLQTENQQENLISYSMVHLTLKGQRNCQNYGSEKKVLKAKYPLAFRYVTKSN